MMPLLPLPVLPLAAMLASLVSPPLPLAPAWQSPAPGQTAPLPASVSPSPPPPAPDFSFRPNYLAVAQEELTFVRRWPRFPLRVFFVREGADSPQRERSVLDGFSEWSGATRGVVRYVVVTSPADADVVVYLRDLPHLPDSPMTVGLTRSHSEGRRMTSAQMQLAADGTVSPSLLANTAAHEWGHVLGIKGHSDDPRDLMYSIAPRADSAYVVRFGRRVPAPPERLRRPTLRDVNTVKAIYPDLFAPEPGGPGTLRAFAPAPAAQAPAFPGGR